MDRKQTTTVAQELEIALNLLRRSHFNIEDSSGLRKSEKIMLMQLSHLSDKQGVMPTEIAKKTGVTLAAVTHQINSLEEQGYVKRVSSDNDRRVTFIKLSDRGLNLVRTLKQQFKKAINGLVEYLGNEDSRELVRLVKKITEYTIQERLC